MRAPTRNHLAGALAALLLALAAAPSWAQPSTALGIQVRQGRQPAAGIGLRLQPEPLRPDAAVETAVTDDQGRAVVYGLAPGLWRLELTVEGRPAYFMTVHVAPGRRAEALGAAARDVDAPNLRWQFFAVTEPPPAELWARREPAPAPAESEARPARPAPPPVAEGPAATTATAPAPPAQEAAPAEAAPAEEAPGASAEDAAPAAPEPSDPAPAGEEPLPAVEEAPSPGVEAPMPPLEIEEPMPAVEEEPMPAAEEPLPPVEIAEPAPLDAPAPALPEPTATAPPAPEREEPAVPAGETMPAPEVAPPAAAPVPPPLQPAPPAPVEAVPVPEDRPAEEQPAVDALPAPDEAVPLPAVPQAEAEVAAPPQQPPGPPPVRDPGPVVPSPAPPAVEVPAVQAPAPEPELGPQPPLFQVRQGSGDCPDCRVEETAVTVERTVAPAGPGACGADAAAAANQAARTLAPPAGGEPVALAGAALAAWTGGEGDCELFGVVLPAGATYRGYRYGAASGAAAGRCFAGDECPVGGAVWPGRPVIGQLDSGATLVYGWFRNTSADRARRAGLTVYYLP